MDDVANACSRFYSPQRFATAARQVATVQHSGGRELS
jgi:hypothetical protein